jgi:serine protease AprX
LVKPAANNARSGARKGELVGIHMTRIARRARVAAATAAVALIPAAIGVPAAGQTVVAAEQGTSSNWSGIWSGSAGTGTPSTLATVRSAIGADTGTAATLTGQGVGIALIDTGVAAVPGLPAAQVVNGPDLSFESQSNDLRYLDTFGHGTHMAGIMIANDTATGTKGLAPKAKLTSINFGTANGAVDFSQTIAAIDWVVAHRNDDTAYPIKVLNLSYGTGGNPAPWTDPVQYAVEQAWKAGIVVVAAAGNAGSTKITDPASDQWVIAVGASDSKGTATLADDTYATFTNTDPTRPVDVLAPGVSIQSLSDPGSNIDVTYPSARVGTTLFRGSGTSQAAAVTSAAVALMLQYKPSLTPDQVKYYIQQSRVWPTTMQAQQYGVGFLSVNAAIAKMTQTASKQTWSNSSGTGTLEAARGTSHIVNGTATLSGENTIFGPMSTTAWAAKAATKTTWSGGVWMGWRFAGDGWTGTSWASKTWASATWTGSPWGGGSWIDPAWSGRYWSGRYWSSGAWSGRYWSSDDWSSAYWG